MGVTNEHSLGWAIAEKLHAAGAEVAFSYQGERLREKLERLTAGRPNQRLYQVDVTDEAALKAV
ncbi:enoyl-[acyl-carrier protein] reductase I, partial [Candidatus Hakubella thermalkaliphila]